MKFPIDDLNTDRPARLEWPAAYEPVSVMGSGYRSLGYVDQLGIWYRDCDGTEFQSVGDWMQIK